MYRLKQKQMAATLDEVLELAKGTHALSQEQLSRILALAPTMDVADLERLKTVILGVREAEMAEMKSTIQAQEALAFFAAGKARDSRSKEENIEHTQEAVQADHLISNI